MNNISYQVGNTLEKLRMKVIFLLAHEVSDFNLLKKECFLT